jgi:hypothetical protein
LFYRTHKAEELAGRDESQGTGLYVVKTCIDAHGWPFELPESTFISSLCIPVLYWLAEHRAWDMITNIALRAEAQREYERKEEQITSICPSWFLHRRYNFMVEKALTKETHRNVFRIVIPYSEEL